MLLCTMIAGVMLSSMEVSAQDERELGSQNEATIKHTMQLGTPTVGANACQANIVIEYLQFDTKARVDSTIQNLDCGASSGDYTVRLRIRDDNDQLQTIEQVETWARENEEPLESQRTYEIGKDVYLIKVTTAKLSCKCAAAEPDGNRN